MRPLLFNADHIANAQPPYMVEWRGGRFVCRLYDHNPPAFDRLLTRFRLAWAVFTGKYDALVWQAQATRDLRLLPATMEFCEDMQKRFPALYP